MPINFKNKWLVSYETLLFDTPDGDLGNNEYALAEGDGYYIRTVPKNQGQFIRIGLDRKDDEGNVYNLTARKIVSLIPNAHAYYDEFLTAYGQNEIMVNPVGKILPAHTLRRPNEIMVYPVGKILPPHKLRRLSSKDGYWNLSKIKNYPQPERIEEVDKLPTPLPEPFLPDHHSIALDAASNSDWISGVSSYSWSHTCTGANLLLVLGSSSGDYAASGATYNSVAMTSARADSVVYGGSNLYTSVWYLIAPATGSNTVAVTLGGTTSLGAKGGVVSYTGAKQSGQPDAVNGASDPVGSTTPTVDVTTVADNCWVFDVVFNGSPITACGNTSRWQQYGTGGADTNAPKTPAGAQTMSWTATSDVWTVSAASFAPAPVAYVESAITGIGITALASKSWGRYRTATAGIGATAIASKSVDYQRTAVPVISLTAIASRAATYARTATSGISLTAIAVRIHGRTKSAIVGIGVTAIASRALTYSRTASSGVSLTAIASRLVSYTRSASAGISLTAIATFVLKRFRHVTSITGRTLKSITGRTLKSITGWRDID